MKYRGLGTPKMEYGIKINYSLVTTVFLSYPNEDDQSNAHLVNRKAIS